MPAKLIIESQEDQSLREVPFNKASITIGRKAGNDLHYNRPEISGTHAAFYCEGDEYFVCDMGSTNGTLLNGAQLTAKQRYPLKHEDVVKITPYRITLVVEKEIGATFLERPSAEVQSLRKGGSGTLVDIGGKLSTGTASQEARSPESSPVAPLPAVEARIPAPPPQSKPTPQTPPPVVPKSAPAAAPKQPSPAAAALQPEAKPRPAASVDLPPPAPPAAPVPRMAEVPTSDVVAPASSGGITDYIWLALGALAFLASLSLIVFLLLGL